MFAINHAATALVFKRRFAGVALVPLLFAVQAMEFAWVVFQTLAVELADPGRASFLVHTRHTMSGRCT